MHKVFIMEALECLKKIEKESIQTIYIDPPYNTKSSNFEYEDAHADYEKWIEEHLILAKSVLKQSGCIFISIDDNKMAEVKIIANEIFGTHNFLGTFITKQATRSNAKHINITHEYVLSYAKNKAFAPGFKILRTLLPIYAKPLKDLMRTIKNVFKQKGQAQAQLALKEQIKELSQKEHFNFLKNYNLVDEKGEIYFAKDLSTPSHPRSVAIQEINLFLEPLKSRGWSSDEKLKELYYQNRLIFKNNRPYEKYYLKESQDNCLSVLDFYSRQGTKDLEKLGLKGLFKTPKPVGLIKYLLLCSTPKDSIILDFFAGSGTTAQAVIEANRDHYLNWSFYLCQKEERIKNNPQATSILKNKGYQNTISNIMLLRLEKIIKRSEYEILKTKSIVF
ncbi:DNA methyltransferase [Helicobacter pylori]|uniref:DNA methyltransferase n=1 Tax=Helicobacter pylori TaxID=210 RepID=UPI0009AE6361|nr:site-specific DNA-methyltransferase [Helicobacter pylori]